ncbi:pro-neuregulin-3, membrane-bound isoform isoform X2 [Cynoglossus semilaevis]|uniref:Pro-neuregulin-3, membrane-bound isoform-like n=1 Tax=Cynoglossus semilaevis TaxID=244447 RepID=A0A3P8WPJ7_CYNSE|nr:pro-neuregulin-3, membrane-bound isoform-like isoform X2 [Cynoglossus semilaevis]
MSECSGAAVSGVVILEEPEAPGATGRREGQAQAQGPLRCAVWPRQQTWLCVVPLLIGFIGLGLSLMLLKWIVVGTVRDYVPTDLVDANRIGQDPIFLSKPSGIPKSADTITVTTSTTTTTTTTTTTVTPTEDLGNPTPRTITVAKGRTRFTATTTTTNPRGGGASGSQVTHWNPVNRNGRGPSSFTTTAVPRTTLIIGVTTSSPSPANPTHDSTLMWTRHTTTDRVSTTITRHEHSHRKSPSPTVPPLHSEHFKPCHEKDLTYCLNGGECFVIETLSGPHMHCKCREGYQGIRCDQFLPKTDSVLSDPKSKEVNKRQVLSITFIAMTISLLGTLTMVLYCRNKRQREKLQAHLKESRTLKNYSANSHNPLDTKTRVSNTNLQMQEYYKRSTQARQGNMCKSHLEHCNIIPTATPSSSSRGTAKQPRSGPMLHRPDQKNNLTHWSVSRRSPPITKGRLNPIGVSKYLGPSYQHLQEVDPTEKESEAQRRDRAQGENLCEKARRDALLRLKNSVLHAEGGSGLCAPLEHNDLIHASRSLKRPHRHDNQSPPPLFRSSSIPIIPSVQCHHDSEVSCMQTCITSPVTAKSGACRATPYKDKRRVKAGHANLSSASFSSTNGLQQDKVALLLEEAQQQLLALAVAHRKHEDGGISYGGPAARETVCFLNFNGANAGALSWNGPTQTQLVSLSQSHRDLGNAGQ